MKRFYPILFIFSFFFGYAQIIHFNDINFKNKLLQSSYTLNIAIDCATTNYYKIDTNNDGEIQVSEALLVCRLNIPASNISDLTGIEYFTNLTFLNCPQNSLTTLDLSLLTQLKQLACYQNNITSLNLNNLSHLQYLYCFQNQITSLNFSYNPELIMVYCGNNQITSLDFSANPLFNDLGCRNNQLTSLNIKNGITQLFGSQTALNECWTSNPNLTSICADAFEIPALQSYLSGCGITQAITIDSTCPLLGTEGFEKDKFTISPNPSDDAFTINFGGFVKEVKLELFTLVGQKIYEETIENKNEHIIDIDDLPKGTYLLKISDGEQTIDKKIIKN